MIHPNLQRSTMQENAVLLHGKSRAKKYNDPSQPKPHVAGWFGWAPKQLEAHGFKVYVPAIQEPYKVIYKNTERALDGIPIGMQTSMVAHSYAVPSEIKWLTDRPAVRIGHLALVAAWNDPNGRYHPQSEMDFTPDPKLAERCLRGVDIFFDRQDHINDEETRLTHEWLREVLPEADNVRYHDLTGNQRTYGHFLMGKGMTSPEFPELIQAMTRQPAVVQ